MTEKHDGETDHVALRLNRFINDLESRKYLQHTLYIQMENCKRENNNVYMFPCIESLGAWNVFQHVEVSFLPIGHTHEGTD